MNINNGWFYGGLNYGMTKIYGAYRSESKDQRTNGPVNAHLRSAAYTNKHGLSEPEFYGDLVYKLKKLKGITDFSLQFGKIISRYRRIGYNLNVMRQSACLVFNPIMVDNYAAFFNCTPVGRASDSMMAPT